MNLAREMGTQIWNPASNNWVNQASTQMCEHSWLPAAVSTSIRQDIPGLECIMQNPYELHTAIRCQAMLSGKTYDVNLIDMQGRIMLSKKVRGGSDFSLDKHLASGIYHMMIRESGMLQEVQSLMIKQ